MKRFGIITLLTLAGLVPVYGDCLRDIDVDGYRWSYHRNDVGDAYHECGLDRMYREGTSLKLRVPCDGYQVELIKVLWDDNRGKMSGTLYVHPGNHSFNSVDISSKNPKITWDINRSVDEIEIQFAGPRDQMAKVNWIRIYYGNTPKPAQSMIESEQSSLPMIDRIKFTQGPRERHCRVLRWDGSQFIVLIDRGGNRPIQREMPVSSVERIVFGDRWGHATGFNNMTVPFKAKRFENGKIWFDKKEGARIIAKDDYPIEKFSKINFNQ